MLACLAAVFSLGEARPFIVDAGQPAARIVISAKASPAVRYAAEELRDHVRQIAEVELTIGTDDEPKAGPEIAIGPTSRPASQRAAGTVSALRPDGYLLRVDGDTLVIYGTEPRGSLYGVYGLLEDHLGCRWFTPSVSKIPKRQPLILERLDEVVEPRLEYREPFTYDCFDGDWAARNRMNSSTARLEVKHGGKVRFGAGWFVHTFDKLVPPSEYFETHPEYFSLVGGKRVGYGSQLCCTNPDVRRIAAERILKAIEEDPEATVFSVSQNDWDNHCECDSCQAVAREEESQMGPVLQLVNHVAAAVAEKYPEKSIETLAYQWTRKAPKTLRPLPNVIVRLCSIECCFSHPLDGCDSEQNKAFVQDLREWGRLGASLWIWDYVTSFSHYFVPFPNLRVRKPNIQTFLANGVRGIFEQDNYQTPIGEFNELSGYLNAKLLWNSEADPEKIIEEFLDAVYGHGAPHIKRYLDALHDYIEKENIHLNIWVGPLSPHLTDELMASAMRNFDRAEAATTNEPAVLSRVRAARLSVDYAWLERARAKGTGLGAMFRDTDPPTVNPDFRERLDRFVAVAKENGVTTLREGSLTVDDYAAAIERLLKAGIHRHDAYRKPVFVKERWSDRYPASGEGALTDGIVGTLEFSERAWQGYLRVDLDAVIDMQEEVPLDRVVVGFLESTASWILAPSSVELMISRDGVTFESVATRSLAVPEGNRPANRVEVEFKPGGKRARYVRLRAKQPPPLPSWHVGAGEAAWIFVDEIEVFRVKTP